MAEVPKHVATMPLTGAIESTIRSGARQGFIADADLATDLATVLTNVGTRTAGMSITRQPQIEALKDALRAFSRIYGDAAGLTGGALADIYTTIAETWGEGLAVTV